MSQVLKIHRGLPASGKSTEAIRWVAQKPLERARVNRDDIRFSNFGAYVLPPELESTVTKIEHSTIDLLLGAGKSVVVDNQNLRAKYLKAYLELAAKHNVPVIHQDFPIELNEALRRNAARDRKVPEEVIRKLHGSFIRKGAFPAFPTLEEFGASNFLPYTPDEDKPKAILLDVDGTAMKMGDRGPFEWHNVLKDAVNAPVIEAVKAFQLAGIKIIVMSGRDIVSKNDTILQLEDAGVVIEDIFMRPEGDSRKDTIIKGELFDTHVRENYNILFALDDRDSVVRFYRDELGLTVFQVDYGDF
jgi:predicted kinase